MIRRSSDDRQPFGTPHTLASSASATRCGAPNVTPEVVYFARQHTGSSRKLPTALVREIQYQRHDIAEMTRGSRSRFSAAI
jgi:hypothetical protein